MAHDDEELDWGEDDGWTADQVVAAMDVDRPADSIPTNGDGGDSQALLKRDDHPHTPQKVGISQEQKGETPSAGPTTRNGDVEKKSSRRTVSRSSSDFGKSLPLGLPQRPATSAPHIGRSDPLAASAMAPSPGKATNGLPPDWEERKSRSNGGVYYFNTKTEETTWTKPALAPALVSTTIAEPIRPDSPTTSRRERDRRRPTSPNVPSTLPPPPFSLPARPAFNPSQQRRERSASPPPRARSRERQKEPDRDARGGRGERRPSGPQARLSPPPRMRDVPMRDPSPEPPRRYRSPSPSTARERGKTGGNRIYNDRARSPPPPARGQRPPSPPRRDDRVPRRPEDRYALPRTRSRSPGPPRRRSPSPPPMRRARTPPRARDLRRPSPPPSSSLPQKRRSDTPPPPPARSTVYTDRFDGPRDHDVPEDLQAKRRRVDDDRDAYDGQIDRRDDRLGSRSVEEGRRMAEDPDPPKRPALLPQDQRFRKAAVKPTRPRSPRRRTPSPPPLSATSDARPPSVANSNSNKRDIPTSERPREGQGTRKREAERIKLPETSAAVVAAYSNRRRVISTKDEEPNLLNSDAAGSRDGAASKLPPSGPGGRVPRAYGPALRDGPPRPKSPETLTGKEPPRGPRASHRSPNVSLRPLSPRRDQSPPRQRSPRREGSPPRRDLSPPRRPRSPSATQQPYGSHRPIDRDPSTMDYEMNTRSSDPQMRRRDSKREPERTERGQFGEAEKIGEVYPSRVQSLAERPHPGPAPKRDRGGRGRNRRPSPPPPNMRVWGQSQSKRSPHNLDENELPIRDEDRNRYGEGPGRSRAPNGDDAPFLGPRYDRDRDLNEFSEGPRHEDNPRSIPPRQPYPQSHRSPFDGTQEVEQDARSAGRGERTYELSQLRDRMELDEDQPRPNSARYIRDDGQSTRSGWSLEDDGQRPDPLPEARRLSIQERDDGRFRAEASQGNRHGNFDTGLEPARENGIPSHRLVRGEPLSPKGYPGELLPQTRRARSSSPGSSSRPNERPQPSPLSRTLSEASAGQKDIMVSSSRSGDLGATRQTQPRSPPSSKQIGNEDRAIDSDDKARRDPTTGRVRILRRELSPIATNGLSAAREPASTQPTPISLDSTRDSVEEPGGPLSAGQASSGKGSLLARLSVPGASSSGDRLKGKRDQPGPSPTGGSSASLQARLENGERPAIGRRDTDDGERRRKKGRRGRGGHGGGRNRDTQG